jgi:hypothetical protein
MNQYETVNGQVAAFDSGFRVRVRIVSACRFDAGFVCVHVVCVVRACVCRSSCTSDEHLVDCIKEEKHLSTKKARGVP